MFSEKQGNKVVGRAPTNIVNGPSVAEKGKNSQKAAGRNVCGCIAISGDVSMKWCDMMSCLVDCWVRVNVSMMSCIVDCVESMSCLVDCWVSRYDDMSCGLLSQCQYDDMSCNCGLLSQSMSAWRHVLWMVEAMSVWCHVFWTVQSMSVWHHVYFASGLFSSFFFCVNVSMTSCVLC